MFGSMGRMLVGLGGVLLFAGVILLLIERLTGVKGLPGNILIQRENFTLFVPLGTMILLSVMLTLALNVLTRLRR